MIGSSLLMLVLLIVENAGSVVSPVVTFNPDLNKIFTGQSLQMTCDVDSTLQEDITYFWFKNDNWIHSEKTFSIASALSSDSGNYQCQTSASDLSDSTRLEVYNELFSLPTITQSPQLVTEGDHVTLTCHTRLSPHRKTTVLQFAFYREGQNIQEFSSANTYEIPFVKLSDSRDYKCEVQTSDYRIKKASTTTTIQVNRIGERELFNQSETEVTSKPGTSHVITAVAVTSLVLVLFLIITALMFLYRTKQFSLPGDNKPSSKAEFEEPNDETENIYTDLNTNTARWQSFSQNPQEAMKDHVTENHYIVC
ncbi:low affinity immunoglobulin gamma Fc region receptor III-A-like isoform 3-T3 [Anomaloglossus baeobatrachus]|uniref:low affinity immunoglobulin gamma Fc region receptor III-A-like isoform X3 n=1 Tax=Anomaloglossus baeobatrachus TaxID=238106 RepID=UPI003F4F5A52